jgi:hypothetical protein
MDRAKNDALSLEISLDYDTCIKQLNNFNGDEFEIKEGYLMMY